MGKSKLLKDSIFQPSSPKQQAADLKKVRRATSDDATPILCIYTDGGPDHRKTSIQ